MTFIELIHAHPALFGFCFVVLCVAVAASISSFGSQ